MTDWTPPPPGSTAEQLPNKLLALIATDPYLSTSCQTAQRLEEAATALSAGGSGDVIELMAWAQRMHARCRLNNKFTGQLCVCPCHS